MSVPQVFRLNKDLQSLATRLTALRSAFAFANSQVMSGTTTIQNAMGTVPVDILNVISAMRQAIETALIPSTSFNDFINGLVSLSDYADPDAFAYYNGLRKLELAIWQMVGFLNINQALPSRNINPGNATTDVYLDILSDQEFGTGSYENPTTEIEQGYLYYKIMSNDTLPDIARRFYDGDSSKWILISQANAISESDLIEGTQIGKTIRIPIDAQGTLQLPDNQVDEKPPVEFTQQNLEQYLYGRDVKVFKKRMQVNGSGDFAVVVGRSNLVQAISQRLSTPEGSLNPIQSDYGVQNLDDTKQAPYLIQLERLLTSFEAQGEKDPRVLTASLNRTQLAINGDALRGEITIFPIGGDPRKISVSLPGAI